MNLGRNILFVILLFSGSLLYGQKEISGFFKNYDISNGLKSLVVEDVVKDHRGLLWIATHNGLTSFDGYTFTTYNHNSLDTHSIPGNRITQIENAEFPYLWVGTYEGGLCKFNTLTGKSIRLGYGDKNPVLQNEKIKSLYTDKFGVLWVCSSNGFLSRILPYGTTAHKYKLTHPAALGNDTLYSPEIAFVTDHPTRDSLVIISLTEYLLVANRITGEYTRYTFSEKEGKASLGKPNFRKVLALNDSMLWVCGWGDGIMHLNTRTHRWKQFLYETKSPLNDGKNMVFDIAPKNDSVFWVASGEFGLGEFNLHTGKYTFYTHYPDEANSIKAGACNQLYVDKHKNLWACMNTGLSGWNKNNQVFSYQKMPPLSDETNQHIYSVLVTFYDSLEQRWLVGADLGDGLYTFENNTAHVIKSNTLSNLSVIEINALSRDSFLLGTYGQGLFLYVRGKPYIEPYLVPGYGNFSDVFTYSMASDNRFVYVGTWSEGLYRIHKKNKTVTHWSWDMPGKNKPGYAFGFRNMYLDKFGKLWFGLEEGLGMFDTATEQFIHIASLGPPNEVPLKAVHDITRDGKGKIWVSTNLQGVLVLNENDFHIEKVLTIQDGIASGSTYKIKTDHHGDIWLSTTLGLNYINHNTFEVKTYSNHNGLQKPILNRGFDFTSNGYLALGVFGGFYLSKPEWLTKESEKSAPVLTQTYVNQSLQNTEAKNTDFHYDENNLRLHYSALQFYNSNNVEYSWMLKGMNNSWSAPSEVPEASFYKLVPGNYSFYLKYRFKGEKWTEPVMLYSFNIKPAWWQTLFFEIAVILLCIGLVYLIFRIRVNQVKRREKLVTGYETQIAKMEMQALRSQMNPHFVFNSLNSIRLFIMKNETERAADYLTKFSRLIRLILNHSKAEWVSLEEELNAVSLYVELEKARFDKQVDFSISVDGKVDISGIRIPPMVIQPYVENAIWHGLMHKEENGMIQISISENTEGVQIEITDNGIGREKAMLLKSKSALENKSFGMSITQDRISTYNKMGGHKMKVSISDIKTTSGEVGGTRVLIQIIMNAL